MLSIQAKLVKNTENGCNDRRDTEITCCLPLSDLQVEEVTWWILTRTPGRKSTTNRMIAKVSKSRPNRSLNIPISDPVSIVFSKALMKIASIKDNIAFLSIQSKKEWSNPRLYFLYLSDNPFSFANFSFLVEGFSDLNARFDSLNK